MQYSNSASAQVVPFDFEGQPVRVVTDDDGKFWFVAADIAKTLDYRMASDMARILDDDEKGTHNMRTPSGDQEVLVINESGLYAAILKSRKPEAKRFKKWVTSEVLPSIRKTGSYSSFTASIPTSQTDTVNAIMSVGKFVGDTPGVKIGIAMAAALDCVTQMTGIPTEQFRRLLPAASAPICSHNATQLGKLAGKSAQAINQELLVCGLQHKNARDEWELTEEGEKWGEAMPFARRGHSGYQILWNPEVINLLKAAA
ncbi:MAG: antirepressor [Nitrosomonadales bacterium SCN 54-20]|nr:MAG: antirepressor [Nitrosomonadales bacterium SCN 54-20]